MKSLAILIILSLTSLQLGAWNLRGYDSSPPDDKLFVHQEFPSEWAHVQNIYEIEGIMSELSSVAIKDKANYLEPLAQLELLTRGPELNERKACIQLCGRYMNQDSRLPNYEWLGVTTDKKGHPICTGIGMTCLPEKSIEPEICVCSRYLTPESLKCTVPKGVLYDSLARCKQFTKDYEGDCLELEQEHLVCFKTDPQVVSFSKWDSQPKLCGNSSCIKTEGAALHLCGSQNEVGEASFYLCNGLGNPFHNLTDFKINDIKYRIVHGKVYKHENIVSYTSNILLRLVSKDTDSEFEVKIKSLLPVDNVVKEAAAKMAPKTVFDMSTFEQVCVYTFAFFGVYMSIMVIGRWILMTFFGVGIPVNMRSAFSSVLAAIMFSVTGALKVTHQVAHLNFAIMLFVSFLVMVYGIANIFFLDKEDEHVEYESVPQYEKPERKVKRERRH
jgi:hypothetical protein